MSFYILFMSVRVESFKTKWYRNGFNQVERLKSTCQKVAVFFQWFLRKLFCEQKICIFVRNIVNIQQNV